MATPGSNIIHTLCCVGLLGRGGGCATTGRKQTTHDEATKNTTHRFSGLETVDIKPSPPAYSRCKSNMILFIVRVKSMFTSFSMACARPDACCEIQRTHPSCNQTTHKHTHTRTHLQLLDAHSVCHDATTLLGIQLGRVIRRHTVDVQVVAKQRGSVFACAANPKTLRGDKR